VWGAIAKKGKHSTVITETVGRSTSNETMKTARDPGFGTSWMRYPRERCGRRQGRLVKGVRHTPAVVDEILRSRGRDSNSTLGSIGGGNNPTHHGM